MSKIVWDTVGERLFETGVKKGVLYPQATGGTYPAGVAWNGLTAITENPTGAEANPQYADDIKYLNLISAEDFGGTIEAFYSPDEFDECDGSVEVVDGASIGQQTRKQFGLCYRTAIGNDTDGQDHGYKLHLIYGATASPTQKNYQSINESPEAMTLSWDFTTTPINVTDHKPSACLTIDSTKVDATKLAALEVILYGKDATTEGGVDGAAPRLPLIDEVVTLLTASAG